MSNNLSRNCLPRKKGAGVKSCDKNIDIIKCQPPLSWWLSQTKKGYYSKGCARDKRWHCVGKCIPFTSCILQFMRPLSCFRCKHQDRYKMTILAQKCKHFLKSSLHSRLLILSFMKCAMLWQARKKKYKKTFLFWEEGKIYLLKEKLCFSREPEHEAKCITGQIVEQSKNEVNVNSISFLLNFLYFQTFH